MESKYGGMTGNERLFVAGLIDSYYDAIDKKDVNAIVDILRKVEMDEASIDGNLNLNGLKRDIDK